MSWTVPELVWAWPKRGRGGRGWWRGERSGWGTWGGQGAGAPRGVHLLLLLPSGGQPVSFGPLLLHWARKMMCRSHQLTGQQKKAAQMMLKLMPKTRTWADQSPRSNTKINLRHVTNAVKRSNDEKPEFFSKWHFNAYCTIKSSAAESLLLSWIIQIF